VEPVIDSTVFPQRLTPFEYYFLEDERPGYPAVFPIRLEWQGRLDRQALERAYRMAHERHPLVSAQLKPARFGRPSWVAGEPKPLVWDVAEVAKAGEQLHARGGLRLFVSEQRDDIVMNFVFHHAAVDGLAAFQFVKDLLLAYAHVASRQTGHPPWPRLEPARLAARDNERLFHRGVKVRDVLTLASISTRLLLQRAALVAAKRAEPRAIEEGAVPRFLVEHLSAAETAALNCVARERGVMLNDLLVRDLFLMLSRWNAATAEAGRPVRILLPTNLRRRETVRMPAANMFGYAFLSRSESYLHDRSALLHSLQAEIVAVKRERRARYFAAGLRVACLCPPLMRWSMRRPWPFATAVFSNLGTSFDQIPLPANRCGELRFQRGSGSPTIRPDTRAAFAVHTYAGEMAVCLRCDPVWFDDDEQRQMLDAYLEALQTTIATRT
jgi:hypothetical protein